jgi:hypothetical protein
MCTVLLSPGFYPIAVNKCIKSAARWLVCHTDELKCCMVWGSVTGGADSGTHLSFLKWLAGTVFPCVKRPEREDFH